MGVHVSQFVDFISEKQGQTLMGILQPCLCYSSAVDVLHGYLPVFGKPGEVLAAGYKGKKNRISKVAVPENAGGLLLKIENYIANYLNYKNKNKLFSNFT
jgi:hypothetical protein